MLYAIPCEDLARLIANGQVASDGFVVISGRCIFPPPGSESTHYERHRIRHAVEGVGGCAGCRQEGPEADGNLLTLDLSKLTETRRKFNVTDQQATTFSREHAVALIGYFQWLRTNMHANSCRMTVG